MIQNEIVRVMVIQGRCLLREALIERLHKEPWIEVCAATSRIDEGKALIEEHRPHVLVMNISLKCGAGISALKKLKRDFFGLVVIAFSCDSEFEKACVGHILRAGADGYVFSKNSLKNLVQAIRSARDGRPIAFPQRSSPARKSSLSKLSHREVEVFCLIGCGHSTRRIAEVMGLSVKTIESYRERIRKKMVLASGAELQYVSTSFMRGTMDQGNNATGTQTIRELLSTT